MTCFKSLSIKSAQIGLLSSGKVFCGGLFVYTNVLTSMFFFIYIFNINVEYIRFSEKVIHLPFRMFVIKKMTFII